MLEKIKRIALLIVLAIYAGRATLTPIKKPVSDLGHKLKNLVEVLKRWPRASA